MNRRGNNFNLVRLMAALLVLAGHAFVLTGRAAPVFMGSAPHRMGILLFFTVGGYLITESWKRDPDYLCYLIRRVFRIFPALAVCIVLTVFVLGPMVSSCGLTQYFTDSRTWSYLKNIFLYISYALPGVFEENPVSTAVNGSLWSLPVEFMMYLIIPAVYEIGRRGGGRWHLVLTALVCSASAWKHIAIPEWRMVVYGIDLGQALEVVPYYFLGSLVSTLEIKRGWNLQAALVLYIIGQNWPWGDAAGTVLSFLVIPYMVFSFAFCEKPLGSLPGLRTRLEFSYGLYLYGFFIQQLLISWMWKRSMPLRTNAVLLVGLVPAGVLAVASERLVEEPARRLSRGLTRRVKQLNLRREYRE